MTDLRGHLPAVRPRYGGLQRGPDVVLEARVDAVTARNVAQGVAVTASGYVEAIWPS